MHAHTITCMHAHTNIHTHMQVYDSSSGTYLVMWRTSLRNCRISWKAVM